MALLKAFGKVIKESGGSYILNECEVLAKGSISSVFEDKDYKRAKRTHELLVLALQKLHFEQFTRSQDDDILSILKSEMNEFRLQKQIDKAELSQEVLEMYDQYIRHISSYGKTASFWWSYIEMIHDYHTFVRSICSGSLDMFIALLPKITNDFFTLNHPNYGRWTTRYHDNLIQLSESHPAVYEDFKKGYFVVKRTAKPFSRIPIDLTSEQTINADAKSQTTDIGCLTDSISA